MPAPPPHRLMSKFLHGQGVILYKSNDDVAFLTTYSLLRIDIASTWSRFGRAVFCHFVPTQRSCWAINRVNSSFQFQQLPPPPLFCADAVRSLLCGAACGPTTANSYIRCFWNVILKNLHNTLRSCLGFELRVIWVIVWFDSLNSRAHSRESSKTCKVWYFENAISENYSLLSYDAA